MAHFSPDVVYFGSMSRHIITGVASIRGLFKGGHEIMHIQRLAPLRCYGRSRELAIQLEMRTEKGQLVSDGVWALRFDDRLRVERISILVNPSEFLRRRRDQIPSIS